MERAGGTSIIQKKGLNRRKRRKQRKEQEQRVGLFFSLFYFLCFLRFLLFFFFLKIMRCERIPNVSRATCADVCNPICEATVSGKALAAGENENHRRLAPCRSLLMQICVPFESQQSPQ